MFKILSLLSIILLGNLTFVAASSYAKDPVPQARRDMSPYKGLESAVTKIVFANNIRGHDAERIDIEVNQDETQAIISFIFSPDFSPNHTVECEKADRKWDCRERQQ